MMAGTLASVSTLLMTVGPAPKPGVGGEGRAETGEAALALDALDQRGLLAADVGACAAAHLDPAGELPSWGFRTEVAGLVELAHGVGEAFVAQPVLAAHINERVRGADRIAGDQQSLDHLERVAVHQHPILERARLALVRVADDVAGRRVVDGELPFQPG